MESERSLSDWLDLHAAQERLLALVPEMRGEEVPVEDASGRVLSRDLTAQRTQPPSDLSAMDGYAIAGEGPWTLMGESRCGAPFTGALNPDEAVRISTGAHIPEGAHSVLMQENASRDGERLSAEETPKLGRHIRKRGFDFVEGDPLLTAGTMIAPQHIALAMAAGYGVLPVSKMPRVGVLDSGDELAPDPANCAPDQIPASNGAMIASMVAPLAGKPKRIGPVGDDLDALGKSLEQAEDCDILITSGGASVGDHDLVQEALRRWGAEIAFWKVAIKPGKPLMVATRRSSGRQKLILGLPGNPVSSFVTAFLFALPAIRASLGMSSVISHCQTLLAGEVFVPGGPRREFLRGISDGQNVVRAASQDSSALASLALANCLIVREPEASETAVGEPVSVYSLQNGGFVGF